RRHRGLAHAHSPRRRQWGLHEHVRQLRIEGRRRAQHHASASEVTMIAQGAPKLEEILIQSESVAWREKSLKGVHEKMLWRNEETGASIALIKFDRGAGIPQPHYHASNQFMFCLQGRYEYTATGMTLSPGSFYCNPKGNVH